MYTWVTLKNSKIHQKVFRINSEKRIKKKIIEKLSYYYPEDLANYTQLVTDFRLPKGKTKISQSIHATELGIAIKAYEMEKRYKWFSTMEYFKLWKPLYPRRYSRREEGINVPLELKKFYAEQIQNSDEINMCGISLRDFFKKNGIYYKLMDDNVFSASRSKKVLRIILLNPFCPIAQLRLFVENEELRKKGKTISKQLVVNAQLWRDITDVVEELSKQKKDLKDRIKVCFNDVLMQYLLIFKEFVCYEPYHMGDTNELYSGSDQYTKFENDGHAKPNCLAGVGFPFMIHSNESTVSILLKSHFDNLFDFYYDENGLKEMRNKLREPKKFLQDTGLFKFV